jgi:hypothetical protein
VPVDQLDGGQQHHATIRARASAVEGSNDFVAFHGWEIEGQKCLVQHGECGSRGCMDRIVSTPISINAINPLRDTRQRIPAMR